MQTPSHSCCWVQGAADTSRAEQAVGEGGYDGKVDKKLDDAMLAPTSWKVGAWAVVCVSRSSVKGRVQGIGAVMLRALLNLCYVLKCYQC